MIIKPNFKNNRKAEKAAALFALGAAKAEQHGHCLNAGEMAALVDGKCTREQLAGYMQHLSGCEKCYGEWLALKTMDKAAVASLARDRSQSMSRIKKYSFIGSALAVAASVAIFVHLSHLPPVGKDTISPEVVPMESQDSVVVGQLNRQEEMSKTAKPRSMAPVEKEAPQKSKKMSAPVPQSAALTSQKMEQARLSDAGMATGDVDVWFEELQKNCLSGSQDAHFWAGMSRQGHKILEHQAGSLPHDTAQIVSAVLVLLDEMGSKTVTEQCRQLLALLAEQKKSR